jgi:hypothetical protein
MATNRDYLPQKEADLVDWADNFTARVVANATAWEIPAAEVTALQASNTAFKNLHEQAASPEKSPVIVAQKNAARDDLKAKIRALADFRLKNPVITPAQRLDLGLTVKDTNPTPIPTPSSRPEFYFKVKDVRIVEIHFKDLASDTKGKPYGVNGAVISYTIFDSAPPAVSPADLTKSVLATRTPHTLQFEEADRGKRVYAALQWQNDKGEKGPFSEIQNTVIP